MRSEDTEGGEGEEEDLEDSELEDRRLVRKCYSTDWKALRRKGSHQDFQWEWLSTQEYHLHNAGFGPFEES